MNYVSKSVRAMSDAAGDRRLTEQGRMPRWISPKPNFEGWVLHCQDSLPLGKESVERSCSLAAPSERMMRAQVPTDGVTTAYATIGDVFAWLCVIGCLGIAGYAVFLRRGKETGLT